VLWGLTCGKVVVVVVAVVVEEEEEKGRWVVLEPK
jgi:hypothetical protein